jgi:hypothetical protein
MIRGGVHLLCKQCVDTVVVWQHSCCVCRVQEDEPLLHPLCHHQHVWCITSHGPGLHGAKLRHQHRWVLCMYVCVLEGG